MQPLGLPDQPFEGGREGEVFVVSVRGWGKCVFKLFKEPSLQRSQKLRFLLEHPPAFVRAGGGHLAWPIDLALNAAGEVVGYVMPFAPGTSLAEFYGHRSLRLRLRIALNTTRVVEALHASGYIVGDMHDDNILARPDGTVTFVDCDSFPVGEFPFSLGRPDFLAPELLAAADLSRVRRTLAHDGWSLATVVFLLVMQCHPFRAVYAGTDGVTLGLAEKVVGGHWPYARKAGPYAPPPDSPPFHALPRDIQALFRRAFELGHADPSQRPAASAWKSALLAFDRQLTNETSAAGRDASPPAVQPATAPAHAGPTVARAVPATSGAPTAARQPACRQGVARRARSMLTALTGWCSARATAIWHTSAPNVGRWLRAQVGWRPWLSWERIGLGLIVAFLLLWWWSRPAAERETPRAKPEGKSPPAFFQESR
jgi:DNA-binding helix-hairpin-helix protein with protein kinase domain